MTNYNDEIWAVENDDGTAKVVTGKSAPAGKDKVSGSPTTIADMAKRIAARNNGTPDFDNLEEAEGAIATEETLRLAGR